MAKRKDSNVAPLAIGVAIGAVVYAIARSRSTASGAALPPVPAPSPDAAASRTSPRVARMPTVPPNTPAPGPTPSGMLALLTSDDAAGALARQVFYTQSVMYSYGGSAASPDGLLGPQTWGAINTLRAAAGLPQSTTWDASTPTDVVEAIKLTSRGLPAPRILPFALPAAVIDRINAEVVPLAGRGAPLLQAEGF